MGRFLGLLLLFFIVVGALSSRGGSNGPTSSEPDKPKLSDAQCRLDIQCYADKFQSYAEVSCRDPVERRAKNNFEWTDKWYEHKFDRRRWGDQAKGTVVYVGDHIKYQNGFGAWTYMRYGCTFDTEARQVVDVMVTEGRFDN